MSAPFLIEAFLCIALLSVPALILSASAGEDNELSKSVTPDITNTPWLDTSAREKIISEDFEFTNHEGKTVKLSSFGATPLAISFVYTRCTNPNKCCAVGRKLEELNNAVREKYINVALIVISYEPEYDTPKLLAEWAMKNEMRLGDKFQLLRSKVEDKSRLIKAFNLKVNYDNERVNIHRIELIITDKLRRFVREFHSSLWNTDSVIEDLARLQKE